MARDGVGRRAAPGLGAAARRGARTLAFGPLLALATSSFLTDQATGDEPFATAGAKDEALLADDFVAALDKESWEPLRIHDARQDRIATDGGELVLAIDTRGTDDATVELRGLRSKEIFGAPADGPPLRLEVTCDWNAQRNGCYLPMSVALVAAAEDAGPHAALAALRAVAAREPLEGSVQLQLGQSALRSLEGSLAHDRWSEAELRWLSDELAAVRPLVQPAAGASLPPAGLAALPDEQASTLREARARLGEGLASALPALERRCAVRLEATVPNTAAPIEEVGQ